MCDLSAGFTLCTCAADEAPDWTLWWTDSSLERHTVRGRFPKPRDDAYTRALEGSLVTHLQGPAPFDFDYTPAEGDVFRLETSDAPITLQFRRGRWVRDEMLLRTDRHRLRPRGSGALRLPPDHVPPDLLDAAEQDPQAHVQVLLDWILDQGHPELAAWLRSMRAGTPVSGARIGPRTRERLQRLLARTVASPSQG